MLSLSSIIAVARDQVSCDLGGEAAILNVKSGVYYGLGSVGARIWNLLQQPRSVEEVRDVLVREYDVEMERCERDLIALLGKLLDAGLVELKEHPGA